MQFNDQAALGFLISQTSHIEREVAEEVYPEITYAQMCPIDTSAHPFAKTITFFSADKTGRAQWINGNADDIPLASTEMNKLETAVHMAAVGYDYSYEELEQAMMLGVALGPDHASAARLAYEQFVDELAFVGNTLKGMEGLFNNSSVTAAAATTGDWDDTSTTEDDILRDVNDAITLVHSQTNDIVMADTLVLPWSKMNFIASERLGDTTMTVLEFLRMNNVYTAMTGQPLFIRGHRRLDEAGTSVSPPGARMVAYRRRPQTLKMHIPMPHRFLPAYQDGPLRFVVPGVFRVGGLNIRRPKEVVYIDGI